MRAALRLLVSFAIAYAPALAGILALPALGAAKWGATAFLGLCAYLFVIGPVVWIRVDRGLARRQDQQDSELPARAPWRRLPDKWREAVTATLRRGEGASNAPPTTTTLAHPPAVRGGAHHPRDRGKKSILARAHASTLAAMAVCLAVGARTLSAEAAGALLALTAAFSGLIWVSLLADAQRLRRLRRAGPDRLAFPAFALTLGALLGAGGAAMIDLMATASR